MDNKDTAHLSIRPVPAEENGEEPIKLEQLEQNGAQAEPETPVEKKEEAPKGDFIVSSRSIHSATCIRNLMMVGCY
jgi:hypothetical protein